MSIEFDKQDYDRDPSNRFLVEYKIKSQTITS